MSDAKPLRALLAIGLVLLCFGGCRREQVSTSEEGQSAPPPTPPPLTMDRARQALLILIQDRASHRQALKNVHPEAPRFEELITAKERIEALANEQPTFGEDYAIIGGWAIRLDKKVFSMKFRSGFGDIYELRGEFELNSSQTWEAKYNSVSHAHGR